MPLYVYRCKTCNEEFEKMVGWSEADSNQTCPRCNSQETQRKMSKIAAFGSSSSNAQVASGSCSTRGRFR